MTYNVSMGALNPTIPNTLGAYLSFGKCVLKPVQHIKINVTLKSHPTWEEDIFVNIFGQRIGGLDR